MDIVIYLLMAAFLLIFAVLAAKFYGMLGAFGGLIGAIFTYACFSEATIVFGQIYDAHAEEIVVSSYPMTYFAWVMLVLTVLNFVMVVKSAAK